jgi:outer membrane receptor for ferrienterochelin and colicins
MAGIRLGTAKVLVILIAWAAAAAPALMAQTNAGARLEVHVVDPDGLEIRGATVIARNALSGQPFASQTNDRGAAVFEELLRGRYVIQVAAQSFAGETRVLEWEGLPVQLDVRLSVAGIRQEVTVTSGSRIEELEQSSPVKVEAVTREQMLATGYERVSDVLSEIPGVVIRGGSTAGVGGEQIQGIDSRQVAVLQDGLPIVGARGIKRGALNLNRQSVARLDRVEVVKGAASPLYGADALGGVINMISREPTEPLQANLNFSGGTLGSFDGRGDIGTQWRDLTVFLDLERHQQNAYGLVPSSPFSVGPDWRRNDIFFKTRYWFDPRFALGFSANAYHNREEGLNAGETGPVQGVYNDSIQNYAIVADALPTNTTTLQLRAYSARYDENSRLDSVGGEPMPPALANLNQRYRRLDGTLSRQMGTRNLLQVGYEWIQDRYQGANRVLGDNAGQQITDNEIWLQDRVQLSRYATLTLGGRITSHSLFGTRAVPKTGLVVRLNDSWTLRGSFGQGFRAPDLGQLYYRFANPASFYQVIGNPTLQPETSRSLSAGVHFSRQRFRFAMNLFRNDVRNLIDSYSAGFTTSPTQAQALLAQYGIPATFNPLLNRLTFVYLNLNNIYTQGFELNAERSLTRSIRVQSAYTYLDAVDKTTGLRLAQRHRHQGYVRTEYVNTRLGVVANVRGTFFGNWLLNPAQDTRGFGYSLWDFYASKDMPRGVQFYLAVDNLANSRDQKLSLPTPTFDRPDYGRMFRVGVRLSISKGE